MILYDTDLWTESTILLSKKKKLRETHEFSWSSWYTVHRKKEIISIHTVGLDNFDHKYLSVGAIAT